MGIEEDLNDLKNQRASAKRQITRLASKVKDANADKNLADIPTIYRDIESHYDQFCDLHLSYMELLDSDKQYYDDDNFNTIGKHKMSLEDYCSEVKSMKDESFAIVRKHNVLAQTRVAQELIHRIELYLSTVDIITSASSSELIRECEHVSEKLFLIDHESSCLAKLSECISKLNVEIIKSRSQHAVSGLGRAVTEEFRFKSPELKSSKVPTTSNLHLPVSHESRTISMSLKSLCNYSNSVVAAYNTPIPSSATDPAPISSTYSSKFKKSAPPTFNGDSKQWAEFRAVWKKYGEHEFCNDEERAWVLKSSLLGKAAEDVHGILVTQHNAYNRIWQRLESIYNNASISVQRAFRSLKRLKRVQEGDYRGLIKFINEIELCYSHLGEVDQIQVASLVQVDELADLLPTTRREKWSEMYEGLAADDKIQPFSAFVLFLDQQRVIVQRLAEKQRDGPIPKASVHTIEDDSSATNNDDLYTTQSQSGIKCLLHRSMSNHTTAQCRTFNCMTIRSRLEALKKSRACFVCFGLHRRDQCSVSTPCENCNRNGHNKLLCRLSTDQSTRTQVLNSPENNSPTHHSRVTHISNDPVKESDEKDSNEVNVEANACARSDCTLFPIQTVPVLGSEHAAVVFYDSGSNTTLVTHDAASKLNARFVEYTELNIVTVGQKHEHIPKSKVYDIELVATCGQVFVIRAIGMSKLTSTVKPVSKATLHRLFPEVNVQSLVRTKAQVDILIGNNYHGLHPREVVHCTGEDLTITKNRFGLCLQGYHPDLELKNPCNSNSANVIECNGTTTVTNKATSKSPCSPTTIAESNYSKTEAAKDSLHTSERSVRQLKTELSEQEETIKQLVLSLSKLEEVEAADKSVIVDLECKLSRHREETSHLTDQLQAYKIREASLEGTITSLQAKVGQLKVELQQSKQSSRLSSDSLTENGESEVQVSELKVKLGRAHSHSKQLELQLCDKDTQLSALVRENKDIKSSLENSKQQALDDLLSVSQEESGLRSELSALVQKHNSLQTQYKTQSRLLAEKQKDMIQLEETLQKHSRVNEKERVQLVENHTRQVTELERVNETLKLSLANETQSAAKIREQLDNMREEALDKQLDDEKQLSDLHEQLSALRGEIRQLERNKKKEVERLTSELSAKDSCLSRLEDSLSAAKSEHQSSQHSLSTQVVELESQLTSLRARNEELKKLLAENEQKLEMTDTESGELCLRNADLSSKLETCKLELKSALSSHEQDKASFQQRFASNEEMERSSSERFEALQGKISLLEEQVHVADGVRADVVQKSAQIDALSERLAEQEKTIADKTKSIRIQQQTINDLKKTIKRELKGMGDAGAQAGKSQDLIDRVRSSPALTDLDRYESPVEDNIPLPARHSTQTTAEPTTGSNSTALAQQYRHEVNGFCGHKDINFEYLKNVVFSFLISRDSESVHLVKALAVLLEFTPAEEKLLKETVEWKMSWWPTTKKPIKKVRK